MTTMIRRYSELRKLNSMSERFEYLCLSGKVGTETFGFDRYLNQIFYKSLEWKAVRNKVIIRDDGCDLGVKGFEIKDKILIHHMNPVSVKDILERNSDIINPEFLICVSHGTHQAIHYGDSGLLPQVPVVRRIGDTTLWRKHD